MREHWRARHGRVKKERATTLAAWLGAQLTRPPLPVVVTLCRVAPRKMDSDNLTSALKAVRDEVAKILRVDDGDEKRIAFAYGQRKPDKPKTYFVEVEIRPLVAASEVA